MEHRVRRDSELYNLISVFEDSIDNGEVVYLEEKACSMLVEYYEKTRLYDKAIDVLDMAIEQFPYRIDLYLTKARLELKLNNLTQCFHTLTKANSLSPNDNEIHIIRAQAFAKKGDFNAAFDELEQYSHESEEDVEIYLCRSYIYEKMRAYKEMFDTLTKALLIENENEEALEMFQFAAEKGKFHNEAIQFSQYLIDQNPYNHLAWFNLGLALSSIAEYEESIKALEYSYIIDDKFEAGYLECAEVCRQIGDYNKAVEIYQECLEAVGEEIEILIPLAESYIKIKAYDKALNVLKKTLRDNPCCDETYFLLGETFSGQGKWYNAISCYHKAIKIEEDIEEYYFALAKTYLCVEEYNKATINFQMAISFGPEDTRYWKEFSMLMIKLGLYNEALHILDEAEDFSYGSDLLYCKSIAYLLLKEKSKAITILEEALEEDYDAHKIIFQIEPELEIDSDIKSIIRYYSYL